MSQSADSTGVESNGDGVPAELVLRQSDAEVALTPMHGFWVTYFRVNVNGTTVKVLGEPQSLKALTTRPTFFGGPLLFPYPLMIRGGAFNYRGRRYPVRAGSEGYPIHGFVRDYAWNLERAWDDDAGAHAHATYDYSPVGDPEPEFPFRFRFGATYTLKGRSLRLDVEATNADSETMPMGFGIHPYVTIPLWPGGRVEDCVVRCDATHLASYENEFGTVRLDPVSGWQDLRSGQRVSTLLEEHRRSVPTGASLAGLYARLIKDSPAFTGEPGGMSWSLTDVAHGVTVQIETSDAFQTMVHYSPPTPTIISPVLATLMPNGFNLAAAGQPSGLIELEPGQTWRAWTVMTLAQG